MLRVLGYQSLDALVDAAVPPSIRKEGGLALGEGLGERAALAALRELADKNDVWRSYIGTGYYGTITPPVVQRNILENPGWYTQYTPYQAEIAQGRLEVLLAFQTMIGDLTGLPMSNASLLDEATAAAEAMAMCHRVARGKKNTFFVADHCHPQTIAVVETRAEPLGIELRVGSLDELDELLAAGDVCGALVQYPTTDGVVRDFAALADTLHANKALLVVATDLLALTLLRAPGEFGADIAVGSSQRFGVPMGYGGPHAGFLATSEDYKRQVPGRLIGVSKDARGKQAYRLALQTREQHIRRDRATSNICTAQVLLAIMAALYAVYHGPAGIRRIAERVRGWALVFAAGLGKLGYEVGDDVFFDTVRVPMDGARAEVVAGALAARRINARGYDGESMGIAVDETTGRGDIADLLEAFNGGEALPFDLDELIAAADGAVPEVFSRTSEYLTHEIFNSYHAEHEFLRYVHRLQSRDLSLTTSMIPLGSCTMKLNATSEMVPVTWPEFGGLHPFAPDDQAAGYREMIGQLEDWLAEVTGFAAVSMQPNAGAQGEYAGLLVIRAYQNARGQSARNVCLIPTSAHGTNPASAIMCGFQVVPVACDDKGNIDVADLTAKADKHKDELAALMVTYPSTHGVFETTIREICEVVHGRGGQVYLDGANMNAQVGLCRPGDYGADVCHLNLHKTFCIPHGGGGPGMGPIGVAEHLAPYLPGHPLSDVGGDEAIGPVSAAPYGSPSILPISWMYIAMMGNEGLTRASAIAILNANYMAKRLSNSFDVLYTAENGTSAHEFVIDCRPFKKTAGVSVEDIAKRLMDFGYHAPTMSWPVPGTLMIEPTESESKAELDRFCDALIAIRDEIRAIETGAVPGDDNPLVNAPHTAEMVTSTEWNHAYTREQAAYPDRRLREHKFWPPVARIDNAFGDRNFVCSCPPMESYGED